MDDDYDRKKPKSGKTANDKMTLAAMTRMVQNKRAAKKSSVASDDSDYERNHRKKRKGKSPIPQTPPESVTKRRVPIGDSDSDSDTATPATSTKLSRKSATDTKSKSMPKAKTEKSASKPKSKSEKKPASNSNSKSSTDSGTKHTKTASKPAVPVVDSGTKKRNTQTKSKNTTTSTKTKHRDSAAEAQTKEKTPSKKNARNAKSMKIKAGDKTKNPKSKSKHAAAASVDVTTNIRPMSAKFKRKSGKNMDKQTTTAGRPTSTKSSGKPKSRLQKSASIAHDLKIDASIWGALDDEKTADLSALALNSSARDAIKAAMNSTYFGHKIKINYRYRLDDNRIGVCRFFGIPLFAKTSEEWIGLVIEHNGVGEHDGTVQNKTYYRCREGKGLFVRPYRVIEDLGNQTRQLSKADIAGSAEMKQLIVDIKNGTDKRPSPVTAAATVTADAETAIAKEAAGGKRSSAKKTASLKKKRSSKNAAVDAESFRRGRTKKNDKTGKGLKGRSKTVTNLDDKRGGWKPPEWMNSLDMDTNHGYDFLADRPFHSKEHLQKHPYQKKGVSVTAFNAHNHY